MIQIFETKLRKKEEVEYSLFLEETKTEFIPLISFKHSILKFLQSQHIDKRKWDQMVASDEQLDFFSLSWVQDILHKDWEMLCDEDGNYILNIPKGSKLGFSYRLQPFFIRSLHVSSTHQGDLMKIAQFLTSSASYVQLNVDSENQDVFQSFGKFQMLDLSKDLEGIKSNYTTNAKRILKKIPIEFILCESTDVSEFISFFRKQKGEELIGFTPAVWQRLTNLLEESQLRGMLRIRTIHLNGLLIAAGAFISHKGTSYFLKGTATPEGKKLGAMYALIDQEISSIQETHHTLDFVGSNNEAIAQFYRKFGATNKTYSVLKQNNLPWILKFLKS